jgi:hypothetical protein
VPPSVNCQGRKRTQVTRRFDLSKASASVSASLNGLGE